MHEIYTTARNNLPAPHAVDCTIRTVVNGGVEDYVNHLRTVMDAAGFSREALSDFMHEYVSLENEERDRERFSLLARAAATLELSSLKSDNELARDINEHLTGQRDPDDEFPFALPDEEDEDVTLVVLGGGPSLDLSPEPGIADEVTIIFMPGMIMAIDASENLGGVFAKDYDEFED